MVETMPVNAKAGCLYPNNARALLEARARGFDNCLVTDMLGNIAELGTANVFMVKDGVIYTPIANGTFLNGITRQRVIKIAEKANVVLRQIAEQRKLDIIVQEAAFVSPKADITDDVIKALNSQK